MARRRSQSPEITSFTAPYGFLPPHASDNRQIFILQRTTTMRVWVSQTGNGTGAGRTFLLNRLVQPFPALCPSSRSPYSVHRSLLLFPVPSPVPMSLERFLAWSPSQLARDGSVRSTSLGAGHHSSSASPHGNTNLSSLGKAVRFPASASPALQAIRGLQHFREKIKQTIPFPFPCSTSR